MTKSECGGRSSLVQPNTAEPLNTGQLFYTHIVRGDGSARGQLAKHWSPLLSTGD